MQSKQVQQEKEKFKNLKMRFNDQNTQNTTTSKKIHDLEKENQKLKRELEQSKNDIQKIKSSTGDGNRYNKMINDLNKQIKSQNKTITELKKTMNKQRTELSQQKARSNRSKLDDASDGKQLLKLKREKQKDHKTIIELRQQLEHTEKRLAAVSYKSDHNKRTDRMRNENNLEQISVQQRKLDRKLKQLRQKEAELEETERKQAAQQKDLRTSKKRMSLQQQQEMDAAEKRFNRKKKQEMADIQKQRLALERQQKLLEMDNKSRRKRKGSSADDKQHRLRRNEERRSAKTKIIIHKKYLCKEYMDTCIKWRKRKDSIGGSQKKLAELLSKIEAKMKRLKELENRVKKGKNNKNEKPNKADLKEYLDCLLPLEDMEEDLGEMLLDLHPASKDLKKMPGELLAKEDEIDRLNGEIEELQNEISKLKLERKLSNTFSGSTQNLKSVMGVLDEDEIEYPDLEDDQDMDDDAMPNPYKLQFSGIYKKVANLEENKELILSELRSLIDKIGDDIKDENNDKGPYITQLSSNYKDNGLTDFVHKTDGLCNEYKNLEQKMADDDEVKDDFDGKGRIWVQNKDKRGRGDNDRHSKKDPFKDVKSTRFKPQTSEKRKRTRSDTSMYSVFIFAESVFL